MRRIGIKPRFEKRYCNEINLGLVIDHSRALVKNEKMPGNYGYIDRRMSVRMGDAKPNCYAPGRKREPCPLRYTDFALFLPPCGPTVDRIRHQMRLRKLGCWRLA